MHYPQKLVLVIMMHQPVHKLSDCRPCIALHCRSGILSRTYIDIHTAAKVSATCLLDVSQKFCYRVTFKQMTGLVV